jgi:hypothetical protein
MGRSVFAALVDDVPHGFATVFARHSRPQLVLGHRVPGLRSLYKERERLTSFLLQVVQYAV